MAKRELTDREKEILERIGSSEAAQRSRQVLDLYRKKDEADKAYEEAQKKSGFAGSGIATDKYFDAEGADLLAKKKEADAAVAAYEQSNADNNFRERASRITMKQFEQEFADIEKQKQQLESEKGSLWDALKPGGVTPSEWNASRKDKNAQIKELESKEAKYRAVRNEKKSHYETDMLPDDVKELLDMYNAFGTANEGIDLANMFTPAQQKSHAQINSQKLKNEQQKQAVAEQLEKMGYSNYKELAEYRKYVTEGEGTDKFTQEMSDLSKKHPVASTAANLALMPARLMTGAMGTLKGVTDDKETDLGSNPKSSYYALTRANREKREAIGESFEDGILSANTKKFLYETADSALESLAAGKMFGHAGGLALGVGAMNESVIDSLESGATNTQALVNGIAAGVFEGFFESVSLSRLNAFKEIPVKTIKDVVKNVGKSVLVNFSEEANTEIANLIFDTMYNGGTSQYYEGVTALMGQGYSEKEARSRVTLDMAKQVGLAGLGGALMGGAFGAYGSAAGRINYNSALENAGKSIVEEGTAEQIIAGAKDVKENDSLRALAEEIVLNEKNEYSKKEYRNIGKAAELLSEQTSEDSIATIKEAVTERLEALGETGDIQLKAEAITQIAKNQKLTKKQKAALEQGTYTKRVINELTDKSGEFSSVWADKASEEVDNLYKRRYNSVVKSTEKATDNKAEKSTKATEQKVEEYKGVLADTLLRDGQDKQVLNAAVDLCFEYGRSGNYTLQDAVESKTISDSIAPEQRQHAYEAGVYQGLKDIGNVRYEGETAAAFANGFTGKDKASRKSYADSFDAFYAEGLHTSKSFSEALKSNESLLPYISRNVAEKAFEAGRAQSEKDSAVPVSSRSKPQVNVGYNSKTLEEKEIDVFFESFANKLGVKITRTQSLGHQGRRANAYVDINKGEVVSSASSDNEYQSTVHESVHIAYAYNGEKMRPIAKAIKEFYISKHSAPELQQMLRSYAQNYKADTAAAEEEFIADCIAGMFSTDEGVNDFINWLQEESGYSASEKKNILERLTEWLLEIVDRIKEIISEGHLNGVAKDFAEAEAERYGDIRKQFLEALNEIKSAEGNKKSTAEGGVIKLSLMNDESFTDNVDAIINMTDEVALKNKEEGNFVKVMKNTPAVILENVNDSADYEVIIRFDALYLAARSDGALKGHYHNLAEKIKKLPEYLEKPDAIVRMNTGRLNILTTITTPRGKNGIISMELNTVKDINSNYKKYNLVVSVFSAKDNYTKNNLVNNGVKAEYKKEDLSQVNPQLYEWLAIVNDKSFNNNIPQNDIVVNSQDMQNSEKKFSYASVKAKTSDVTTLDQAQRLEDIGKASAEEIRQQTGWFRGMDGKWRFEIDDSQMKIRDIDITSGKTKLSEVLDHPALFAAYPQLKDITVSAFPSIFRFGVNGSYNSERKEISFSDEFLVNTKAQKELAELKETPEYREYKERLEKAAREHGEKRLELSKEYKKISQTEEYRKWTELYYHLDDIEAIEELRVVEKEWKNSALGKRYYDIRDELKKLDEVNPQAEIEKEFRASDLGKRYRELELDISGKELTNNKETRNTLIHEIQHAIQDIEGLASGASPSYWSKAKTAYTSSEMKKLEAAQKKAEDYFNMIEDEGIKDDAYRLWYLNDHYFDDNVDSDAVDKEIAEIEARGEAFGYTDTLDRYFELQSNVTRVFNEIENRRRRSPDELYRNTAGEIEARDSTKRLDMTADERKNTRPDIDRKDVVFADGGTSNDSVKPSLDWIDFAEQQAKERSAVSKVTELEKINEELRAQIRHPGVKHIVSQLAVQKVARKLKSGYMSKINFHVLADELNTLYGYIANENGLNWANVQIHLESIATKILDESKFKNPDISDYAKDVLRDVRSVKIKLNDRQKAAVASQYGSYNEFRKRMMGTLVLSEEGMSLDKRWKELSGAYPIFDSSVADADQPLEMVEVVAALRSTYEDMHGMDYDSAKEMLMAEIYEQYFEVPETKYISEEYALKLARAKAYYGERLKEAKSEFGRQREEAYKKAKAEYAVALKGIREEQQEEIIKAKARYNLRVQNIADTRTKEKKRNNIIRNVKRLDKLLRNPGKGAPSAGTNKYGKDYVHLTNIPQEFRKAVIDFCSIFIENDAGVFSGVVKSDNVTVREKKVEHLQKIYAMMQNSESYLSETVAEEMQERIDTVAKIMAERRLAQLSIEELDKVIEITEYLTASINSQVAVWVEGKKSTVEAEGKAAIDRFNAMDRNTYIGGEIYHIGKALGVNNYKPVYFFERVGGVLEKLFLTIQNDGQRAYARNINAAAAFMEGINKKYNYQKWQKEKELVLTTKQGHKLKLTKAQAMHIWATAERERIAGKDAMHLMQGGIVFDGEIEADTVEVKDKKTGKKKTELTKKVFKYKTEDGSAHRIHFEDVMKISEYLTAEQKAFVNECIRYLSVDMAALGNEISMELYGIRRFNEQYYIPYNSAKNFIYRKMGENGNAMLKNKSFTKETVFGANNPLVVGDFLEVVAKHIEEMSMYNAMVLPLDNFNRVWNYKTIAPEDDPTKSGQSVKSAMETAFGKEYVAYVEQLLEDINGGINTDARQKALVKLTSRFKKTAVLASASVVIQQPSAMVRAFAEIDPKYFVAPTFAGFAERKKAWENALKYSSTALLKDIGGFDTVSGQNTVDWLTKEEYKGKDKVLKLFTDGQYRDDVLAWGPGFADKVTWAHIWAACEREVRAKQRGLSGEALYEAVGKRFDEVVNKTQVYDSVLTRSSNMRSRDSLMQMATSFMAEPTTQANMLASAVFDLKNKDVKKGIRKAGSVALSQLFNAVLVSMIYAARDDDEDETLAEKYISELVNNFLGSLNPLTLVPVYKDVMSMLEGYDVKRTDMSLVGKIVDAVKALRSTTKSTGEKIITFAGSAVDLTGFPLSNLIRDGLAVKNVISSAKGVKDTTGKGITYAIQDDMLPVLQNMKWYKPDGKDERLYYAFRDNDENMYNRLASQYKTGGAIKSALKKQIEAEYLEDKLTDDEAIAQLRRLGFSENEAYYEVRKLKEPVAEEESEDSNVAFKSFSEMQNIQSEADAELEEERQQASEGGKTYSEDADYTWLRDKLKAADTEGIAEEIKQLKDMGVDESKINAEVKKWLKDNDTDVQNQAEQSVNGNYTSYESKVKNIADKYGVDDSTVASAIRNAAGSNTDSVEGTIYALGDLHFALDKGSEQTISNISSKLFNAKLQNKLNEGVEYDKAYSSVRTGMRQSITSKWKEAYIAGNSSEKAQIKRQLWFTRLWDSSYDLDKMLKGWLEG